MSRAPCFLRQSFWAFLTSLPKACRPELGRILLKERGRRGTRGRCCRRGNGRHYQAVLSSSSTFKGLLQSQATMAYVCFLLNASQFARHNGLIRLAQGHWIFKNHQEPGERDTVWHSHIEEARSSMHQRKQRVAKPLSKESCCTGCIEQVCSLSSTDSDSIRFYPILPHKAMQSNAKPHGTSFAWRTLALADTQRDIESGFTEIVWYIGIQRDGSQMRHLVYVMLCRAALSCVMRVLLRYLMLQCVVFEGELISCLSHAYGAFLNSTEMCQRIRILPSCVFIVLVRLAHVHGSIPSEGSL